MKPPVSPSIHPDALAYERSRPGYPAEAVDALVAALPGRDVIDLAAGTGKLTRDLLARGLDVVAVEPRAEMRAAIEPPARVIEGSAEAIPLPAGSADAVAIAQAFHWFAVPAALAEIHRVLRSDGVLALLWNRRLSEGAHAALEQVQTKCAQAGSRGGPASALSHGGAVVPCLATRYRCAPISVAIAPGRISMCRA
ncbi:MAG: hypothetical protein QOD83_1889 [Solirubrobacteraceae bacterium]|nr:hypothetical protein [Solirubrobacteraceae bacterium]